MRAILVTAVVALALFPASEAHADGIYKWKNMDTENYLEVWLSSKTNGSTVITWPHSGSRNQQWRAKKLSGTYYRMTHRYSGRALDRFDRPVGTLRDVGCPVTIWDWWGTARNPNPQQQWRRVYTDVGNGYGNVHFWINKKGCQGNANKDSLAPKPGQRPQWPNANDTKVYLYTSAWCSDLGYGIPTHCYWK